MYPRLKSECYRLGFTMGALAKKMGWRPAKMSARYRGKTKFTLQDAIRIKETLGTDVPIEELFRQA